MKQLKTVGVLAVLLAATACTATSTGAKDSAPRPSSSSSSPEKAVNLEAKRAKQAAEAKQAELAGSVLSAGSFERGSGYLDTPTGNLDASLASGTRVRVQAACVGTGSVTVSLASGENEKHRVSETFTCAEGGASSHTMDYRLAAKGLMVGFEGSKGASGGFAYAVLKA